MKQDKQKIQFAGNRPPLTYKDNSLRACLKRHEVRDERVLTLFAELVAASGLERALAAQPCTVLVPHNLALARFQRPANQEALKQFIRHHVLDGRLTLGGPGSKERYTFPGNGQVRTRGGHLLKVERGNGIWLVTGSAPGFARVLTADLPFTNGVFHVLDRTTPIALASRID